MSCDEVYISDVEDGPQSPLQGAPPTTAQVTRLTNSNSTSSSSHVERPAVANNSHQKASSITTGSQLKAAPPTNSQKAPLPPIPQHHYEQAQHQILINKQMDNAKMKLVVSIFCSASLFHGGRLIDPFSPVALQCWADCFMWLAQPPGTCSPLAIRHLLSASCSRFYLLLKTVFSNLAWVRGADWSECSSCYVERCSL